MDNDTVIPAQTVFLGLYIYPCIDKFQPVFGAHRIRMVSVNGQKPASVYRQIRIAENTGFPFVVIPRPVAQGAFRSVLQRYNHFIRFFHAHGRTVRRTDFYSV